MAENRGGFRPTAPQNNPANINSLGGNGQSGTQAARYIPGMGYGKAKEMVEQQRGAAMQGSFNPARVRMGEERSMNTGPAVVPLTAPTQNPEEVITTGANAGKGPGTEILNLPKEPSYNPEIDMIRMYLPAMEFWAAQPGTPQTTKDYVAYLRSIV
jgi:hypothetical protein